MLRLDRPTLLALRAALLMLLAIIEDMLGIERSVPTRQERKQAARKAA